MGNLEESGKEILPRKQSEKGHKSLKLLNTGERNLEITRPNTSSNSGRQQEGLGFRPEF